MFSTQQYFGFDPRTIPGCTLWLDGADSNTLFSDSGGTTLATVGGTVGYWRDKSGVGRHYTQSTAANRPLYDSLGSVTFNTSAHYLTYSGTWTTGGWDVFTVSTPLVSTANWKTMWRGATTDHPTLIESGSTRLGYFHNASLGFQQFGSLTFAGGTRRMLYVSISASRAYSAALDGTVATSAAGGTGTADSQMFFSLGSASAGGQPWGTINEVIIVPNTTLAQRQQIEGYLAWKWGLQANLPTGHPFKSNPTAMRIFQPNDISGLQLWFDGLDPNGNGTVPANNAALSTWVDKSGTGNSGTAIGTTPLYQSNSGVLFSTGGYNTSYSASLANESMFFVYTPTSVPDTITLAGPTDVGGRTITVNTSLRLESSSYFVAFGSVSPNSTVTLNQRSQSGYINTASSMIVVHNGTTYSPVSLSYTAGRTTKIGVSGTNNTIPFKGTIHEVLAYNVALTASQRQQIEGYLAAKWGLSGSLPTTQPFYLQRALPSTPLFVPVNISNLGLWLDGADPTTITGTTTVTAWNDKSGNGRNATATSNHPSYTSGTNYIQFSGSNWMSANLTFLVNTQYTLFYAVKRESSKVENFFMSSGSDTTTNTNLHIGFSPNTATIKYSQWANQVTPSPTTTAYTGNTATEPNNLYSFQQTSNQRIVYVNGSNISATTNTSLVTANNDGLLGVYFRSPTTSFQGRFYEVIMFTRALSTSERQQVEGYLAWKYNFQQQLATTHPYYRFRP